MARRRRRRSGEFTGGPQFVGPNVSLPRDVYLAEFAGEPDDVLASALGVRVGAFWEPEALEPGPVWVYRGPTRSKVPPAKPLLPLNGLRYLWPGNVVHCFKRSVRREVLFALNRAGYSGSARKKKWRRNAFSQYGC